MTLAGHTDTVISIAFSLNGIKIINSLIGNYLASASYDKTIILWNMSDYSLVKTLTGHTDTVTSVAFSRDGN